MKMLLWCLFGFVMSAQCQQQINFDLGITDGKKLEELSRNNPVNASHFRFRKCVDQLVGIPYTISNEFPEAVHDTILEGLDHYESRTYLRFIQVFAEQPSATLSDEDSVVLVFIPGLSSESQVIPFVQPFVHSFLENLTGIYIPILDNLGDEGLQRVIQQVFYALQFQAENLRSDRDNYVIVLWENIIPGYDALFRQTSFDNTTSGLPYDFRSISHYYPDDFAIDGKYTLISKIPNIPLQRNTELSTLDVFKINHLFCEEFESSGGATTTNYN